jgi:bifunctional DNA-binding transcriptional regulator/antitoxin component of YhaV-PrlF toxin-antitoxin module
MKSAETVIRVRGNFKTHIPKPVLESLGVKEGDYIQITVKKMD